MDYLKQKQVVKRRLYGKTVKIILLIVIILLIRPTWNIYKKSRDSAQNLERARKELAVLEQKQKELSLEVESLKSEEGRDQEIREKFGVAKAGETVVILVDSKDGAPAEAPPPKQGFFARFWSGFTSWFNVR